MSKETEQPTDESPQEGAGKPKRSRPEDELERRSHRRHPVKGVRGRFLMTTDARVIDLSIDGMSIESYNPLKIGRNYELKLDRAERSLPLKGRVVWCSLVRTARDSGGDVRPVYRAGIHFEDVISGRAADLRQFIEENAVVSLEKRLFGRFRIEKGQPTTVGLEAEFLVLELSLSGMLIQTEFEPKVESEYEMEIEVEKAHFSARVRIARLERRGRGAPIGPVLLGVEFVELKPTARQSLTELIHNQLS